MLVLHLGRYYTVLALTQSGKALRFDVVVHVILPSTLDALLIAWFTVVTNAEFLSNLDIPTGGNHLVRI